MIQSIELQRDYWDAWNASNREQRLSEVSLDQRDIVLRWLHELDRTDLDLIEVGFGAGWLCPSLKPFGRVTATDLSPHVLGRASQRVPDVRFIAGDFMALDIEPASFDAVKAVRAAEAAQKISTETNGRVQIDIFPNGALGSDTSMLSQLRAGAVEFFTLSGPILSLLVPVASINGIGFAFADYDAVWRAMDGELGAYVRAQIAKTDLVAMDRIWDNGFRQITSSTRPIVTPDNLRDFRIRVPVGQLWISMFRDFDAAPISLNFSEVYSALKNQLVEGQENPLAIISFAKLYDVQKYCSLTNHMWDGFWFLANRSAWERLPADLRIVVIGYTERQLRQGWTAGGRIWVHGIFHPEQLPRLAWLYGARLALFPPGMPESHCYALTDAWMSGLAVLAPDHGALAERVRHHGGGSLYDPAIGLDDWCARIVDEAAHARRFSGPVPLQTALPTMEAMMSQMQALYDTLPAGGTPRPPDDQALQRLAQKHLDGQFFRLEVTDLQRQVEAAWQAGEACRQQLAEQQALAAQRLSDLDALQQRLAAQQAELVQAQQQRDASHAAYLGLRHRVLRPLLWLPAPLRRGLAALGRRLRG